jgi:hypothetical protein
LVDECLVHEYFIDVTSAFAETLEYLIFDIEELLLIGGIALNDLNLLLLELRVLECYDLCEHLILQSGGSNCEVDDRHLDEGLRGVVGVRECGGEEELEFLIEAQGLVSQCYAQTGATLHYLLE